MNKPGRILPSCIRLRGAVHVPGTITWVNPDSTKIKGRVVRGLHLLKAFKKCGSYMFNDSAASSR